jgi:hypothetical protein
MKNVTIPYLKELHQIDLGCVEENLMLESPTMVIEKDNWKEFPHKPAVIAWAAYSDHDLYILFAVQGETIKAAYKADGSPVHEDSCVEFFMKRTDSDTYMNFEFNCIGTCDAATRVSKTEKTGLTPEEYARIRRFTSTVPVEPFEERPSIHEWSITVAIPLDLMGLDIHKMPAMIEANFYKCGDLTADPHFLSWSPIDTPEPNFHCPDQFGKVYLKK